MRLLTIIFAIHLLFGNFVYAQKENPKINAGKVYKQSGVKIFSPNEADWQIVKSASSETIFGKTTSAEKFNVFVKTKTIPEYANIGDLFENLEKLKSSELNMSNRDALHFNQTSFKETPCMQYDGIFNNDANYKYFNFSGYLCQHPNDKKIAIQMEFSNYSNVRGFSENEVKLSKDFLGKIQFSKIKK